jgi:hypothetical protein
VARSKDYSKAYRRRIERGLARGLTRQEARGHGAPRPNRRGGKDLSYNAKLEEALKQLRRPGGSIAKVAKEAGVGRERLSRYVKTVAGAHRDGKIWRFDDRRIRRLAIIEADELAPVVVRVAGFEDAHRAGLHAYEAGQALLHPAQRQAFQRRWEGARIRDVHGQWHTLSTDLNQIYRAILTQDYSFERFYAIEHGGN